ncbi:MAG: butyrate kinase [Prevotellaceae bacterium]|jgi:butyrate kinase|nr:butyrate kinase [Prevotellaceae bacterium]
MIPYKILAINPGSTSTKIALFEDELLVFGKSIRHESEELSCYAKVVHQFEFRKDLILKELNEHSIPINNISAVVGRGGLLKPIPSGVYEVNQPMIDDLLAERQGEHASNLGGLIAADIAKQIPGCKAYIADPVVVDELKPVARVSGHPSFQRVSIFHALNQKAVAKNFARETGKRYDQLNLIVAHLGGGISVGAHQKGKVIDVNNALDGEGPFSPERSGSLPSYALAKLCFSGSYTLHEVRKMIVGEGGMVAFLGTNQFTTVCDWVKEGREDAKIVVDAMSYQVAKAIGAMAVVLKGDIDAVLITGGMAYSKMFVQNITEQVAFLGPVKVYPGEDEMFALAMNGLAVLRGDEAPKEYS